MARTSRNGAPAATVDALDNLNLDDMFADEGDALFDGLDIDLGNMDDIAESSSSAAHTKKVRASLSAPMHPSAPAPAVAEDENDSGVGKRRMTKRKIKSPMFFEEEDDDYVEEPSKKKKKRTPSKVAVPKVAPKKKGSVKSTSAASAVTASAVLVETRKSKPPATAKTKKTAQQKSVTMPPPSGRPGSVVAAAGQFGGRQKRGGAAFSLPITSKAKAPPSSRPASTFAVSPAAASGSAAGPSTASSSSSKGPPQRSQSVTAPGTLAQILATHPGLTQGSFCGLLPSNTLFYPFMPALPSEPSFKHRKVFAMIDRVHTSFMSHVTSPTASAGVPPAQETEAIFQLMQEAFREERLTTPGGGGSSSSSNPNVDAQGAERSKSIGNAVGALRRSIVSFEKNRLAGDLMAVCALLKRQYDFLKQNMANMEHWCKNHFSEQDYASVYQPTKSKAKRASEEPDTVVPSVLSTFKTSELKVKVICSNFREPKSGQLVAILPTKVVLSLYPPAPSSAASAAASIDSGTAKGAVKSKKRKLSPTSTSSSIKVAAAPPAVEVLPPKQITAYSDMRPSKRRKSVSDLIARSARELESKYLLRFDDQRQLMDRQQSEMRQLVQDDPVQGIHTLGMWKLIEKSGYFGRITGGDIQWRLDGIITPDPRTNRTELSPSLVRPTQKVHAGVACSSSSVASRLQSLLVCEDVDDPGDDRDSDFDQLYDYACSGQIPSAFVVSQRSTDASLNSKLDSLGLRLDPSPLPALGTGPADSQSCKLSYASLQTSVEQSTHMTKKKTVDPGDELGDVIHAMIDDLRQLNDVNNRRTAYLESIASAHGQNENSGKKAEEASLIARCQQLLRKSKEAKGKNGKMKTAKKDEYALPW